MIDLEPEAECYDCHYELSACVCLQEPPDLV